MVQRVSSLKAASVPHEKFSSGEKKCKHSPLIAKLLPHTIFLALKIGDPSSAQVEKKLPRRHLKTFEFCFLSLLKVRNRFSWSFLIATIYVYLFFSYYQTYVYPGTRLKSVPKLDYVVRVSDLGSIFEKCLQCFFGLKISVWSVPYPMFPSGPSGPTRGY